MHTACFTTCPQRRHAHAEWADADGSTYRMPVHLRLASLARLRTWLDRYGFWDDATLRHTLRLTMPVAA